jgi:putative ABC transport system substrate-binding protein
MERRDFVKLVGGAVALPLAVWAQQPKGKTRRIGWIEPGTPASFPARREAFLKVMREAGFVEGQNLIVDYRYSHGKIEQLPALAAELVALKPECVVATGIDAIRALHKLTSAIPIVMGTIDADPVKEGLVASMARPGGNVTGMVGIGWEIVGKRLELLKEVAPKITRVAVIFDPRSPAGHAHVRGAEVGARALKLQLQLLEAKEPADLNNAFRAARGARANALYVPGVGMVNSHRPRIVALAIEARLPAIYSSAEFVGDGGLMAYAANGVEQFRRVATYVDKILKGAKPGDLPIQQPTTFELAVNLKTARAIGLAIPKSILGRADRVIE